MPIHDWTRVTPEEPYIPPEDKPLTIAAYIGGNAPEVYIEAAAIGSPLPDMPLFLTPETYVPVPLDQTSQTAWNAVPAVWRNVLESKPPH